MTDIYSISTGILPVISSRKDFLVNVSPLKVNFGGFGSSEGILLFVLESQTLEKINPDVPKKLHQDIRNYAKRVNFSAKAGEILCFDDAKGRRVVVASILDAASMFELLTISRKAVDSFVKTKVKTVDVVIPSDFNLAFRIIDGVISAFSAALYQFPKYSKQSKKEKKSTTSITFVGSIEPQISKASLNTKIRNVISVCEATNLVRYLAKRAGNDLTCRTYRTFIRDLTQKLGASYKEWTFEALKKMGAGAFVAVAQGSTHRDSAIVKLTHQSKNAKAKHVCLVGKGIVFDTGGSNLKPAQYMMGMNHDMAGSAVALAMFQHLVKTRPDLNVSAFLAITDNSIGPDAYRQNDVIYSLKGTTIEIVHTDAEGRMILSDTLFLASKEKPDLMMDFATLTGACVGAIGTRYSGVFTNRPDLHEKLISAGKESGERIWPFPMDKDLGECLESDVADIKQCRLKGGVDHIEAAIFLKHFVDDSIPWVHWDLSAVTNEGGLAHVPTEETGFGPRVADRFIQDFFS